MELIEKVKAYLASENRNAADAVGLLSQMGPRQIGLARRAGRNPHSKFIPMFDRELERYVSLREKSGKPVSVAEAKKVKAAAAVATATEERKEFFEAPVAKTFSDEEYLALPDSVKQFSKENDKLQKLRSRAKNGLELATDDEQRRQLAESIADMTDQINSNFDALNYFKQHGVLPTEGNAEESPMTLPEAMKALSNERSNRSKAKGNLNKAKTEETKAKYELKFADADAQVLKLEALVAKLENDAVQHATEG